MPIAVATCCRDRRGDLVVSPVRVLSFTDDRRAGSVPSVPAQSAARRPTRHQFLGCLHVGRCLGPASLESDSSATRPAGDRTLHPVGAVTAIRPAGPGPSRTWISIGIQKSPLVARGGEGRRSSFRSRASRSLASRSPAACRRSLAERDLVAAGTTAGRRKAAAEDAQKNAMHDLIVGSCEILTAMSTASATGARGSTVRAKVSRGSAALFDERPAPIGGMVTAREAWARSRGHDASRHNPLRQTRGKPSRNITGTAGFFKPLSAAVAALRLNSNMTSSDPARGLCVAKLRSRMVPDGDWHARANPLGWCRKARETHSARRASRNRGGMSHAPISPCRDRAAAQLTPTSSGRTERASPMARIGQRIHV